MAELDSLRGLAALSVFIGHACAQFGLPMGPWGDGGAAVCLFFVLSGFVLARSLLLHEQSYGAFVWRRFLRIYPAYWAAILLALILLATCNHANLGGMFSDVGRPFTLEQAVKHFFLIVPGVNARWVDYPIWSLIVEMRVSLVLPFMLAGFLWLPSAFRVMALVASLSLALVPGLLSGIDNIPMFLLGIALAVYSEEIPRPTWAPAVATGIGLLMYYAGERYVSAIGAALIIWAVIHSRPMQRSLSVLPLRFLGDISYSFYLVHLPVLAFVTSWMTSVTHSRLMWAAVSLLATIVVATVLRKGIELPAMRFGRALEPSRLVLARAAAEPA